MICIGVDVGLTGAIAAVSTKAGLLELASLPTCASGAGPKAAVRRKVDALALRRLLGFWSVRNGFDGEHVRVVIERMTSHGSDDRSPPATLLSMGYSAGLIEGVLSSFASEPILQPLPRQWKGAMHLHRLEGESDAQYKRRSVEMAQRLYPTAGRIRHDAAEAILIAAWGLAEIQGLRAAIVTTGDSGVGSQRNSSPRARKRAATVSADLPDPFARELA